MPLNTKYTLLISFDLNKNDMYLVLPIPSIVVMAIPCKLATGARQAFTEKWRMARPEILLLSSGLQSVVSPFDALDDQKFGSCII